MCLQLLPPLDKHHSAQLELLGIRELAVTQAVSGQCHQKTSALTRDSLAGLHVIVDPPVLHGGAHHWRLADAALHLTLGGQVDDH